MIGDFDGSSNELWTLFKDEAKNHDDARIDTLRAYMKSAVIFVCSYPICTCEEPDRAYAWPHRPVYILLLSLNSYSIVNKP